MTDPRPIGVFDSGIGGLTVVKALVRELPNEEIIYFGDTAHMPYGDKSADAIRYYCLRIGKFLLDRNCKMIVVACNSASAAGYHVLLDFFREQALFVNVIDPLVERVARHGFHKVGVIGTKATINSDIYAQQLRRAQPDLDIFSLATPLLAPMIEEGYFQNEISQTVLHSYLKNPGFEGMDALLLACTHYPLIRREIQEILGPGVQVFDSTDVVAQAVRTRLTARQMLNDQKRHPDQFYVSDYTPSFEATTRIFYQEEVHLEHVPGG